MNIRLRHALLPLAMLLAACGSDPYDTGEGSLSQMRADFVEAHTDANACMTSVETDGGERLTLTPPVALEWAAKPDTTYRALLYYNKTADANGTLTAEPIAMQQVLVPQIVTAEDIEGGMKMVGNVLGLAVGSFDHQHQAGVAVVVALHALVAHHVLGLQTEVVLNVHGGDLKLVGDGVCLQQGELAYLYHKAGMSEKCIDACDELILWFGDGPYVERALELKMLYQPLTKQQEDKYRTFRQRHDGVVEVRPEDQLESGEIVPEPVQIKDVKMSAERFNTQNLQEELQKSMQEIMNATEKEAVNDTMDNIKKLVEDIPYLQIPSEKEEVPQEEEIYQHIETDEEIDNSLKSNFQEMLVDEDGHIYF